MENLLDKSEILGSEMDELLGGKKLTISYTTTDKDGKTSTVTVTYDM